METNTAKQSLFSEVKIGEGWHLVKFLNFHASFEKVRKEVRINAYRTIEDILSQRIIPEDVAVLMPVRNSKNEEWFCVTQENGHGIFRFRIGMIEKGSVVNIIPPGAKAAILLEVPYKESCAT